MTTRAILAMACCLLAKLAMAQTATDVTCTSCIDETDIKNQAVTSDKIANGTISAVDIKNQAVTSDKIANGTVSTADIAANAITSDRIKNQTIVMSDLAPSVQDDIGGAINNLTVQRISATGGGVVAAQCPSGRIPVGASCECDDSGGTRNAGVLFGCTVDGNGAAAGCFSEARSFNPTLGDPLAIVRAVCLGAESVDGTPWVPTRA